MRSINMSELDWIHDCQCDSIVHVFDRTDGRIIRLAIQCPADLGYAPWNGRTLTIEAIDVAVCHHILWSVAGLEAIDSINVGVSNSLRDSMSIPQAKGVRFPAQEFTISFRSGSTLEIVCRELRIHISA